MQVIRQRPGEFLRSCVYRLGWFWAWWPAPGNGGLIERSLIGLWYASGRWLLRERNSNLDRATILQSANAMATSAGHQPHLELIRSSLGLLEQYADASSHHACGLFAGCLVDLPKMAELNKRRPYRSGSPSLG